MPSLQRLSLIGDVQDMVLLTSTHQAACKGC
jgi:hypothetical protein